MENTIYITIGEIYFSCKIGEIISFVILALYLIINISGLREIEKKKYPTKVLYIVIPLMVLQTLSLLGSKGDIGYPFPDGKVVINFGVIAYYIGFFILGILSTSILFFYIQYWDKVTKKNIDK